MQEYLIDLNATQAAIRAGYSAKTANEQGARLLANVSISDAIKSAQQKHAERVGITIEFLSEKLVDVAQRSKEAGDIKNERQCYLDLGKLHGLIIEKRESKNTNRTISEMSDYELEQIARGQGDIEAQERTGKPH